MIQCHSSQRYFQRLYQQKDTTGDVDIISQDNQIIKAHRLILYESSPYLAAILDDPDIKQIELKEWDYDIIQIVLKLLYNFDRNIKKLSEKNNILSVIKLIMYLSIDDILASIKENFSKIDTSEFNDEHINLYLDIVDSFHDRIFQVRTYYEIIDNYTDDMSTDKTWKRISKFVPYPDGDNVDRGWIIDLISQHNPDFSVEPYLSVTNTNNQLAQIFPTNQMEGHPPSDESDIRPSMSKYFIFNLRCNIGWVQSRFGYIGTTKLLYIKMYQHYYQIKLPDFDILFDLTKLYQTFLITDCFDYNIRPTWIGIIHSLYKYDEKAPKLLALTALSPDHIPENIRKCNSKLSIQYLEQNIGNTTKYRLEKMFQS